MKDLTLQLLLDLTVVPYTEHPDSLAFYEQAVEKLNLTAIDYLTIRDLVTLSGMNTADLHLLLIALFISLSEGSVCLHLSKESLIRKLKPITRDKTSHYISEIIRNVKKYNKIIHVYDPSLTVLFDNPRDSYKPIILVERNNSLFCYFQKYFSAERCLKATLGAVVSRTCAMKVPVHEIALHIKTILITHPLRINGEPVRLNTHQKLGLLLPCFKNFVLISGGPGTGKTFIVQSLLRLLLRMGIPADQIKIAAPTGRAAQKMTDSLLQGVASCVGKEPADEAITTIQGTTIHRLLGYSPSRNDYVHNKFNKIKADILIVDEASMVDIVLLSKLFDALDEKTGIVMLGDRNQLPSVEAGAVLADLIPDEYAPCYSKQIISLMQTIFPDAGASVPAIQEAAENEPSLLTDRVVILNESYRSEKHIKAVASRINTQDYAVIDEIPVLKTMMKLPEQGVWRIDPGTSGNPYIREQQRIVMTWADYHYGAGRADDDSFEKLASQCLRNGLHNDFEPETVLNLKKLFSVLDDSKILTPVRTGISGAAGINNTIREHLTERFDPAGNGFLFAGAPIIITKNDYSKALFNGDIGVVMKSQSGHYYGVFSRFTGFTSYPVETLPHFELAYAITVHKSQGSEYSRVLYIIPDGVADDLLTKEIVYTGITRAKKLVIIYSSRDALSRALQNKTERESGIRLY